MPRGVPNPKKKPHFTRHQQRAVELLKQSILGKDTRPIRDILIAAGYSPSPHASTRTS